MRYVAQRTRIVQDDNTGGIEPASTAVDNRSSLLPRIVYGIASIIGFFLVFRFILALLGANQSNTFVSFVYSVSHPLVAPFFGMFNYRVVYGVSRFEFETLIALAVYSFIAYIIVLISGKTYSSRT